MSDSVSAFTEGNSNDTTKEVAPPAGPTTGFVKGHRTRASRSKSAALELPNSTADIPPDATNQENEDPLKDDSEAETVLSSPVKRREASKKSDPSSLQYEDHNAISPVAKVSGDGERAAKSETVDDDTISRESPVAEKLTKSEELPKGEEKRNDDHQSRHSPVSRSSSDVEHDLSSEHGATNGNTNGNPRKRKHRDSSGVSKSTNSSLKRQRRSSVDQGSISDGSVDELSPAPRLRRHKRTMSLADNKEGAATQNNEQSNRSRRATSQLVAKDQHLSLDQEWDSESDSELSTSKTTQSRTGRNLNRSVSTPGRPLGRDHKRHVNKYGFTRLAEACESGDLDAVKEWRGKDPEQLEQREFAGNTPLQIASLNGYPEIVAYLLQEGCNPHCANTDKDTPLIDAVENSHVDVVKVLLDAGVDPLRQNMKGQQALDVITEDMDDGPEMRTMLRKAIESWKDKTSDEQAEEEDGHHDRPGPKQGLHFMARTPDNLMKLVSNNDRKGVTEFLDARVPVDNTIVAAAARTGDLYLVNMLLAEMSPRKARSKAERPMLAVLGSSHFEMVKTLTELDQFNPTWRSKANGLTWYEVAENRLGPHWRQERDLLHRLYTTAQSTNRLSSSPVQRMDNGARRQRSPATSRESDLDMDEGDSPDAARIKRRLLSRKDMRAATSLKSASATSSRAPSPRGPLIKDEGDEQLKSARRKPGRPRTKSISSAQAPEVRPRKIKQSKESISLFDSSQGTLSQRRKQSTSSTSRPAVESFKPSLEKQPSDQEMAMVDSREEEHAEAAKAAQQKAAEEEQALIAAELAERKRKETEERRAARDQKLATFPGALEFVLASNRPVNGQNGKLAVSKFLPLHAVCGTCIGREGDNALYMLTYQAAGLLRGAVADHLLEIPTVESIESSNFPVMEKLAVSPSHLQELLIILGATNLISPDQEVTGMFLDEGATDFDAIPARAWEASRKFLSMGAMQWIKVRDFFALKADLQVNHAGRYPHLAELPAIEVSLDVYLDVEHPFVATTVKTEVGSPALAPSTVDLNDASIRQDNAIDEELRRSAGPGLRARDGKCLKSRFIRRTTPINRHIQ